MKKVIAHPTYGEIVYEENIWSGKKTATVGGAAMRKIGKNTYTFTAGEESVQAVLKGSFMTGACLNIAGEEIRIVPKPKWYDWLLSLLPPVLIIIWGNSMLLCSLIPVVGGAIGGAIGGAGFVFNMFRIRETHGVKKVLTALFVTLVTLVVGATLGCAMVFALMP